MSSLTCSAKNNIEIHAIDANTGVVFDSKINVFLDAEAEVAGVAEVVFPQLVLTNLREK